MNKLTLYQKNKELASDRVALNIGTYTYSQISIFLGIDSETLKVRLKEHNWNTSELNKIIKYLN